MLKIGKGLKKKIKGKKSKHDEDDLFDPEQLDRLKKELEQKRAATEATEGECSSTSTANKPEDEEWAKFKVLTAGVDASLKKTSEELGKIKETSFYQRQVTDPTNLWRPQVKEEPVVVQEVEEEKPRTPTPPPEEELEKNLDLIEQEAVEVDDSLFDTSYLDAIAAGDIQLNYIPDSPTEEEGDDPFDTSGVASVIKRIEEEEKKAKRQVNLGAAVNVLSGKGATPTGTDSRARPRVGAEGKRARARPRAVNLLGDSENAPAPPIYDQGSAAKKEEESILDDIFDTPPPLADEPLQLVSAVQGTPTVKKEEEKSGGDINDILGEFDLIAKSEQVPSSGLVSSTLILKSILEPEEELDDEFAALAAESLHQKSPQPPHQEEEEEAEEPEEDDPFDTAFVEKVAPSAVEKKEAELFALSPTTHHAPTLSPTCRPSAPPKTGHLVDTPDNHQGPDPFDTSTVEVVLPGRAELKLLEEELLNANLPPLRPKVPTLPPKFSAPPKPPTPEDDFDFDPRADEKPTHLFDEPHELSKQGEEVKVLTPSNEEEDDPFDTSALDHLSLVPGQTELKLLATELTKDIPIQYNTTTKEQESDEDFDPRGGEEPDPFVVVQVLTNQDLFDTDHSLPSHKVLTPQTESAPAFADSRDPFDTSSISLLNLLPPSELKQIEGEILSLAEAPKAPQIQLKAAFSAPPVPQQPHVPLEPQRREEVTTLLETEDEFHTGIEHHKPLTPLEVDLDPFDTSIAEGVVPGRAEIRVLEEELQLGIDHLSGRRLSDPDFDPRQSSLPQPVHPASLSFVSRTLEPTRVQDSVEVDDPFDTSGVQDIAPSSTVASNPPPPPDLKALEAELL